MTVRQLLNCTIGLEYKSLSIENHEDIICVDRQDGHRVNGYDEYTKPFVPEAILDRQVEAFDITQSTLGEVWLSILTPDYIGDEQYY